MHLLYLSVWCLFVFVSSYYKWSRVRSFMDFRGFPWISMNFHGISWVSMDSHAFSWISVDFLAIFSAASYLFCSSPFSLPLLSFVLFAFPGEARGLSFISFSSHSFLLFPSCARVRSCEPPGSSFTSTHKKKGILLTMHSPWCATEDNFSLFGFLAKNVVICHYLSTKLSLFVTIY